MCTVQLQLCFSNWVPRNADESLEILYVVVIILASYSYSKVKLRIWGNI